VGKSTLLNALVGEKVSIVSPKPQTTRGRITGILTLQETQYVFTDTPGAHQPKNKLGGYMNREIAQGISDVDVVVLVSDGMGELRNGERKLAETLAERKTPAILCLNKIDAMKDKTPLLAKIQAFSALCPFEEVLPVSAKRREGTKELLEILGRYAKPAPHYYEDSDYTTQTEREMICETIREKLLLVLGQEIPHGTAVGIEQMKLRENGIADIFVTIYCERESHKGIIIGAGGEKLKRAASLAREDIERLLDCKANLQCRVKAKENWRNNESSLRQLGFKQ
jgi:GTP-binding protein Era